MVPITRPATSGAGISLKNYGNLLDAAVARTAHKHIVRLHKDVPIFFHEGTPERTMAEDEFSRTIEITFRRQQRGKREAAKGKR